MHFHSTASGLYLVHIGYDNQWGDHLKRHLSIATTNKRDSPVPLVHVVTTLILILMLTIH